MNKTTERIIGLCLLAYAVIIFITGVIGALKPITSNIVGLLFFNPIVTLGFLIIGLLLIFRKEQPQKQT